MRHQVKDKLKNFLKPLIKTPASKKYQYWFALLLNPWYVMELKDINNFHQSETVDTKKIVQNMITKFYDYFMDSELAVNPNTQKIPEVNKKESLYLHKNNNSRHSILSE